MIQGVDGKRLSKRHGAVDINSFLEEGYLVEALVNYLVKTGWSYGDQEFFSLDELLKLFTIFKLIMAELCIISKSCSPVKTKPAPPISAAN